MGQAGKDKGASEMKEFIIVYGEIKTKKPYQRLEIKLIGIEDLDT